MKKYLITACILSSLSLASLEAGRWNQNFATFEEGHRATVAQTFESVPLNVHFGKSNQYAIIAKNCSRQVHADGDGIVHPVSLSALARHVNGAETPVWTVDLDDEIVSVAGYGKKLLVQTLKDGKTGTLHCLRLKDGKLLKSIALPGSGMIAARGKSALVLLDHLQSRMHLVNPSTLDLREAQLPNLAEIYFNCLPVAVHEDTVVFGAANKMIAYDARARKTRWIARTARVDETGGMGGGIEIMEVGAENNPTATDPSVLVSSRKKIRPSESFTGTLRIADGVVVSEDLDGHVVAIDLKSGKYLWKRTNCQIPTGHYSTDAPLLVSLGDKKVAELDPKTGAILNETASSLNWSRESGPGDFNVPFRIFATEQGLLRLDGDGRATVWISPATDKKPTSTLRFEGYDPRAALTGGEHGLVVRHADRIVRLTFEATTP